VGTDFHPAALDLRRSGLVASRAWSGGPGAFAGPGPDAVAFLLGAFLLMIHQSLKNLRFNLFSRCLLKRHHYILCSVSPETPYMHTGGWDEIALCRGIRGFGYPFNYIGIGEAF
jgi:hypothetical protein